MCETQCELLSIDFSYPETALHTKALRCVHPLRREAHRCKKNVTGRRRRLARRAVRLSDNGLWNPGFVSLEITLG